MIYVIKTKKLRQLYIQHYVSYDKNKIVKKSAFQMDHILNQCLLQKHMHTDVEAYNIKWLMMCKTIFKHFLCALDVLIANKELTM